MADGKPASYRDEIAADIIRRIEAGTAPWQKPWRAGELGAAPFNPVSGKPYRGINDVWLSLQGRADPRWMTYKQAVAAGAQVRKGELSTTVEFWQWAGREPMVGADGRPVLDVEGRQQTREVRFDRPRVFHAKVFNAGQIDGLAPWVAPAPAFDPVERAEALTAGAGVPVFHDQNDRAFYSPARDSIHLPPAATFHNQASYYATVLHELGHATGHANRLARAFGPFGSEGYAREELRAEIASYMLARDLGISFDPSNHAAYVESWLKVLREDRNEIFRAARDAETIKTWVMEPEKRLELERAAQGVAGTIVRDINQHPAATTMPQPMPPEKVQGEVLSAEDYERKILTAMKDVPGQHAFQYLSDASVAYLGLGPQQAGYVGGIARVWNEERLTVREADLLLARTVIAANWPVKAAEAMGLTEGMPALANLVRELPRLDWTWDHSEDHDVRQKESARISTAWKASVSLVATSREHAELVSVMWDKLAPVNDRAPDMRFDGYVPADQRQSELVVKLAANPYAATLAAHGMPTELVRPATPSMEPSAERQTMTARPESRTYIAVPYAEKDAAKSAGAKWDRKVKSWYVPDGMDASAFARWAVKDKAPAPDLPPEKEFGEALKAHGLVIAGDPDMDGKWHRVPVVGDKGAERSGCYRGFLDGRPAGNITNYKAGTNIRWVSAGVALTGEERARLQAEAAQIRADREASRLAAAEKAAKAAFGVWQNLPAPATPENCPYLGAKGVGGHGVKVDGEGHMVVPARDAGGKLWTLQFVGPEGKRWIKGSHKVGCMHVIEPGGKGTLDALARSTGGPVVIAEGYATAARIFEATGRPVVVAFDCDNLRPVAEAVLDKLPGRDILIAADNDHANKLGNVGAIKAAEAAKAVGGRSVTPQFTAAEMARGLTDFDDLGKARGNAAVRQAVESALAPARKLERGVA